MSPDELRAAADRAKGLLLPGIEVRSNDLEAVLVAARRLADVIEYAESDAPALMQASVQAGYVREGAQAAKAHVLRIARGDTTNQPNGSER